MNSMRTGLSLLGLALVTAMPAAEPPKLSVVISVDQLRYDHLDRFSPYFGEGGFKRMRANGLDFRNAHYRHGVTRTAPGHSVVASGVHANLSGVVANEWVDRSTWSQVASVEDPRYPLVGAEVLGGRSPGGVVEAKAGRSPMSSSAPTIGDQLKLRFGAASRVVAVANKDRSAILMGGKLSDGTYWIDRGRFVTSTFFRSTLPGWVESFNAERRVEAAFGQEWSLLLKPEAYASLGADDAAGEGTLFGLGTTFPKTIDGGKPAVGSEFYEAFTYTPSYTVLLAEFAKKAVLAEKLGQDAGPDILWMGFSQPDHTGHLYGPDSWEVMDTLVRLDAVLADFFVFLDREVGAGNYVVVLTADHGVAPLPERVLATQRGIEAGRLDLKAFDSAVNDGLASAFGAAPAPLRWAVRDGSGYHLYPETLQAMKITAEAGREVVRAVLAARPEVARVFTREVLLASGALDQMGESMRLSYHPTRSPDVVFVTKPYFFDRSPTGTTHGTPYNYDTHVPLLWFGAGVPAGTRGETVGVDDLVPTLGNLLGIGAPPDSRGNVLF
jgi:predicted AlkP superfamily pyrophosphatase or phosphodiesterase